MVNPLRRLHICLLWCLDSHRYRLCFYLARLNRRRIIMRRRCRCWCWHNNFWLRNIRHSNRRGLFNYQAFNWHRCSWCFYNRRYWFRCGWRCRLGTQVDIERLLFYIPGAADLLARNLFRPYKLSHVVAVIAVLACGAARRDVSLARYLQFIHGQIIHPALPRCKAGLFSRLERPLPLFKNYGRRVVNIALRDSGLAEPLLSFIPCPSRYCSAAAFPAL